MCSLCNTVETILHLLYECKHAQRIWNIVKNATNIEISKRTIFFGNNCSVENNIVSQISYFIYKEWIIRKHENKERKWESTVPFLTKELNYNIMIHNLVQNNVIKETLQRIKLEMNK